MEKNGVVTMTRVEVGSLESSYRLGNQFQRLRLRTFEIGFQVSAIAILFSCQRFSLRVIRITSIVFKNVVAYAS